MDAMAEYARNLYNDHPELIGAHGFGQGAMTLADQQNVAFANWMSQHKHEIQVKVKDLQIFADAVAEQKQDRDAWFHFTDQMIDFRVLNGNEFEIIWKWVFEKLEMQLPLDFDDDDPFSELPPLSSESDMDI